MNSHIIKLFGLFTVLFALLIGFTSWWSVLDADTQKERSSNRRALIEEQTIPRGLIFARDGRTVLAKNIARGPREDTPRARNLRTFVRTYPEGPLFGHAVGYSYLRNGRRGLEQSENRPLAGEENEFQSIFSQLRSQDREGRDVVTTLDPGGQKAALSALAGKKGAIVALEPQTGRVRVMASTPTYDPNQIPTQFGRLNGDSEGRPLNNRATQERYPPGSTFKVVTAAAALDTGKATPESTFDGSSPQTISGSPLTNFGGESFGPVSFTEALTNSVNTVFARVGERVGRRTLIRYMDRFGFGQDPPLDYPNEQMIPSGVVAKGRDSPRRPGLRRRPRGHRPGRAGGADPRHADADGDGGLGGGQRGQADAPDPGGAGGGQGRSRHRPRRPRPAVARDVAEGGRPAGGHDEERRQGGHRHRRPR